MNDHRLRRRLAAAAVLAAVLLAVPFGTDAGTPAVGAGRATALDAAEAARVTITVQLGAAGTGTFRMTGGLADGGRVVARRSVSNRQLRMTQTMTGGNGKLVISSSHSCARATGRWNVVSGTRSYRAAGGGGTASGRIRCTRPWKLSTALYTGVLTTPLPALATPGPYGGWTTQDEGFGFEVAPSGRTVSNLALGGYSYECVSQSGIRTSVSSQLDLTAAGPYPIAEERSFVVELGVAKISGRFTSSGAAGTIMVQHTSTDYQGQPSVCAGQIPWTVTTPPPPPRRALAGAYCGFTTDGQGACLDVPEGGREFRNLRVGVLLSCGEVGFLLELTVDLTVALRANLTFVRGFTQPIPGGSPVSAFLRGSFDQAGAATGSLSLPQTSFTHEGNHYTCRGAGARWTVKLQR